MARIRSIKPEFWTDEKIVTLSPYARLLFMGLWNFVDDEGRCEYSPMRLKLQILPVDKVDMQKLFAELHRNTLTFTYSANGKQYLQVTNFSKHQKIDKRTQSKYPPPNSAESPRFSTELHDGREGNGGEGKGMEKEKTPPLTPPGGKRVVLFGFDSFWKVYPKRVAKGRAEKAWKTIMPSEQLLSQILAAIERAKTSDQWAKDEGRFIPHPASWLNAKGWEDEHKADIDDDPTGMKSWLRKHKEEEARD